MSTHLHKRSLAISGHKTSVALEPEFWRALDQAAGDLAKPVARLVAEIDAERHACNPSRSLASAIRVWLLTRTAAIGRPRQASLG